MTTLPPRPPRPAISCVVPAYNEAENLGPLLAGMLLHDKVWAPRRQRKVAPAV